MLPGTKDDFFFLHFRIEADPSSFLTSRSLPECIEHSTARLLLSALSHCKGFMAKAAQSEVKKRLVLK